MGDNVLSSLQNLLKTLDRLNEAKGFARDLEVLVGKHSHLAQSLAEDISDVYRKEKLKNSAKELDDIKTQIITTVSESFEDDSNAFGPEKLTNLLSKLK